MLEETLNKIKQMESAPISIKGAGPILSTRINPAMLEKDQKIQIQNEELQAVANLTYEEIAIRSQQLSVEIEIRNEKRQALRAKMSQMYEDASEEKREQLRKYSIVPQTFREDKPAKQSKSNLTPEEKRDKKIKATMMQFNLTQEKAIKYLQTLEED